MHIINSLKDIPEFKNAKVNVRNEPELLQKLNKLIKDGANNLQIVSDFDHTLTRHSLDNGEPVLTSFGMFFILFYLIFIKCINKSICLISPYNL